MNWGRWIFRGGLLILIASVLGDAVACPVCDTEAGRQVREGIFGADFGRTLLATLAPIPVVCLAALGLSQLLGKGDKA